MAFSEWGRAFLTPRVAAIVDRLTFHADIIETGTESYWLRTARATRGRKKSADRSLLGPVSELTPEPSLDRVAAERAKRDHADDGEDGDKRPERGIANGQALDEPGDREQDGQDDPEPSTSASISRQASATVEVIEPRPPGPVAQPHPHQRTGPMGPSYVSTVGPIPLDTLTGQWSLIRNAT